MNYDPKIDELLKIGSAFDFDHNSKWNKNGQFCNPSIELLSWIAEVKQFILDKYGEGSSPYDLIAKFDAEEEFTYAYSEEEFKRHIGYLMAALTVCKRITPLKHGYYADSAVDFIFSVFERFHKVAVQLQLRHDNRDTIEIKDEYDVQDLMGALLRLKFDDIREEECAPSCAGAASRIDFLLKEEKIAVEIKMTRKGLADKELGNQLIEDIKRYKVHPSCNRLMCFVYDKDERIRNPQGLIGDLMESGDFSVDVFISPKR